MQRQASACTGLLLLLLLPGQASAQPNGAKLLCWHGLHVQGTDLQQSRARHVGSQKGHW